MSDRLFERIFDESPVALILVDSDGNISLLNRNAEKLFGYPRKELVGQPIGILVPASFRDRHAGLVKQFQKNPSPRQMGVGRELYGVRKNGDEFPIEVGLNPIQTEEGQMVMSSIVDITERVQISRDLRHKNDELEQFAYRTSHDLRSPLMSVGHLTDFILEDLADGRVQEASANIVKVKNTCARLGKLVQGILTLSRANNVHENLAPLDLAGVVADIRDKHASEIETCGFVIREEYGHRLPLVTQPTRMTQVLENLLSNAIKYRNPDSGAPQALIRTRNDDNRFYIDVTDNGIGIPEERTPEVFGMFKRFHTQSAEGSGLGLYIAKRHIDMLSGKISFESSSEGSTFHLSLPLEKAPPSEA